VTVDGKVCGGPHRHANCSLLPAANCQGREGCEGCDAR
jgi:hypothetical protein